MASLINPWTCLLSAPIWIPKFLMTAHSTHQWSIAGPASDTFLKCYCPNAGRLICRHTEVSQAALFFHHRACSKTPFSYDASLVRDSCVFNLHAGPMTMPRSRQSPSTRDASRHCCLHVYRYRHLSKRVTLKQRLHIPCALDQPLKQSKMDSY